MTLSLLLKGTGAPYVPTHRNLDTLVDSFGSLSRWTSSDATSVKPTTPNGILTLTANGTNSYDQYVTTIETLNLAGSSVYGKFPAITLTSGQQLSMWVTMGAGKYVMLTWSSSGLQALWGKTGASPSSWTGAFTTTAEWARIREANGTFYFDKSTDGSTWVQFASQAHPFTSAELDSAQVRVENSAAPGAQQILTFDHINYTPPVIAAGGGTLTFDGDNEVSWQFSTSPKNESITVGAGDLILTMSAQETYPTSGQPLQPVTGGGLTWTSVRTDGASQRGAITSYTATSPTAQTFTIQQSLDITASVWGFNALVFTGSGGIGASNSAVAASGAGAVTLTTTADHSGVLVGMVDWSAVNVPTRTWQFGGSDAAPGTYQEITYYDDPNHYLVAMAYYNDVGLAGAKSFGISQSLGGHTCMAIEVLRAAGAPGEYPRRQLGFF